jgi:hypothetical protein
MDTFGMPRTPVEGFMKSKIDDDMNANLSDMLGSVMSEIHEESGPPGIVPNKASSGSLASLGLTGVGALGSAPPLSTDPLSTEIANLLGTPAAGLPAPPQDPMTNASRISVNTLFSDQQPGASATDISPKADVLSKLGFDSKSGRESGMNLLNALRSPSAASKDAEEEGTPGMKSDAAAVSTPAASHFTFHEKQQSGGTPSASVGSAAISSTGKPSKSRPAVSGSAKLQLLRMQQKKGAATPAKSAGGTAKGTPTSTSSTPASANKRGPEKKASSTSTSHSGGDLLNMLHKEAIKKGDSPVGEKGEVKSTDGRSKAAATGKKGVNGRSSNSGQPDGSSASASTSASAAKPGLQKINVSTLFGKK